MQRKTLSRIKWACVGLATIGTLAAHVAHAGERLDKLKQRERFVMNLDVGGNLVSDWTMNDGLAHDGDGGIAAGLSAGAQFADYVQFNIVDFGWSQFGTELGKANWLELGSEFRVGYFGGGLAGFQPFVSGGINGSRLNQSGYRGLDYQNKTEWGLGWAVGTGFVFQPRKAWPFGLRYEYSEASFDGPSEVSTHRLLFSIQIQGKK